MEMVRQVVKAECEWMSGETERFMRDSEKRE
jgi:hypothetical protein